MAAALPFAKLATLLIKTLAKPVSKRIKKDFSKFKGTRQMLVSIGQTSHAVTSRMTIWSEGYKVRRITPLEEDKALGRGADFMGEGFILMVSSGTMIWEYNRSNEKSKKKEAKQRADAKAERDALQENFQALDARLRALEDVVEYNSSSILNIGGKKYVEPKRKQLRPILEGGQQTNEELNDNNNHQQAPLIEQPTLAVLDNKSKAWWSLW